MTITLTVNDVIMLGRCPDSLSKRMTKLARGREQWTLREILKRKDIPAKDRVWLGTHSRIIGARWSFALAYTFALRVLPIYEQQYPGDARARHAIEVSHKYVCGKASAQKLHEARTNVLIYATDSAIPAYFAAYAVAHTTHVAARTVEDATWHVAHYAAHAIANYAVEREWQLERIREVIAEIEKEEN